MSNLPPPAVLAKRLEHELKTIAIYAPSRGGLRERVERAQEILAQLQEAMR